MKNRKKLSLKSLGITVFILFVAAFLINTFFELALETFEISKVSDYLYSINCPVLDYRLTDRLIDAGIIKSAAGCSTVRSGDLMGHNFDWTYDDEAEYIVRTSSENGRYATIGVASLTGISDKSAARARFKFIYYGLPYMVVDGINEKGLCVCINEVPAEDVQTVTGTNPGAERLCFAVAPRYLLDYASSVEEAIELLSEKDLYNYTMNGESYAVHLMISDRHRTAVVELIDNKMSVLYDEKIMTNFYLGLDELTDHSEGVERYDILSEGYDTVRDKETMFKLLESVFYSKFYDPDTEPVWRSEVYGEYYSESGEEFTVNSDLADFAEIFETEREGWSDRVRNGKFWATVHTSVYNLKDRTLDIRVGEGSKVYSFAIGNETVLDRMRAENEWTGNVMISLDTLCLLIAFVILYGMIFENHIYDKKSKWFLIMIVHVIVALSSDLIAWCFDGNESYVTVQWIANYIAMISAGILAVPFIYYEYEYLYEKKKITIAGARLFAIYNIAAAIVQTVLAFMGKMFYFEEGVFFTTPLYDISVWVSVANIIIIIITIFCSRRLLSKHDFIAFIIYAFIPLMFASVELLGVSLELGFVAVTFSEFFIYIMLQTGKTNELRVRHKLMEETFYIDQLTMLNNRRAYDKLLDEIEPGESVGAVFCDANRLKYTNDTYGHKAGDELLIKLSELILKYFDRQDIYRISGDEFVVIMRSVSESEFSVRLASFGGALLAADEIAASGGAYGKGEPAVAVIGRAEKLMYEVKADFHARHPEFDR